MTASITSLLPLLLLLLLSAAFTHAAPRPGPASGPRPGPGPASGPRPGAAAAGPLVPVPGGPASSTSSPDLPAARKRSPDGPRTPLSPDKTLQTLGGPGSAGQRSANDAWAADSPEPFRTSGPGQEAVCNCSSGAEGVLDPDDCDPVSGQCSCVSGYSGLQCEDCEDGHFTNGSSGCLPCACDSYGAVNALCDSSGICVCKVGVYGPKCDECNPGFFHFSSTGCRPCQCNNHTSSCHPQSGVCLNCEGNTQGANCEECRPAFHRSLSAPPTHTCTACPCSNASSTSTCHSDAAGAVVCDQCLRGYSGPHCDRCISSFYRSSQACVPCDCSGNADPQGPAGLCHPDTGHCLHCLNGTTGARCHLCAPGLVGDAREHNCTRPAPRLLLPTPADSTPSGATKPPPSTPPPPPPRPPTLPPSTSSSTLLSSLSSPTDNTTAALTEVSWTQFNIIVLAVIILVVLLLLSFVGGVYTYREYQNRKLNAPFWTIELKEDNISFSSYHDSIPNADVSGLLEDEANEVAPNGQLALTTQGNCYKA